MSLFNSINNKTSEAVDLSKKYVEKTNEYYKLKLFQQLTSSFSFLTKMAVIGGFIFLGLIFMAVSGAIALGNYLNSITLSCLIIGGGLMIISLLFYFLRKQIDKIIIRKIAKTYFD
ncbi:hypothetical protein [Aquimarina brevivitae]|uniref:Uncharacterized protein n=1 Tax=Aquimarina brevivitae TaxID=323412 RepID=A0A4Q7PJ28_9FLAO|nr:hypothetical protein [Aquimarina brevivitae]RZT00049.1 hypothetical protein EV197_1279 [Aquimarina brevivitae]